MAWRALMVPLARAALFAEQTWPRLWPAAAILLGFLGFAFLDPVSFLPGWLHTAVLLGFAVSFAVALWAGIRSLAVPAETAAERRLERDGEVAHRPLQALKDSLGAGGGDGLAESLWQAHLRRASRAVRDIRLAPPRLGLGRIDPFGIRAGVVLLLLIGTAAGYGELGQRLGRTLTPHFGVLAADVPTQVEAWITPPRYTGGAPVFLSPGQHADAAIEVIAGSALMARVAGPSTAPSLEMAKRRKAFATLGGVPAVHQIEAEITGGDEIEILSGSNTLARWPITVRQDAPPTVALIEPPKGDSRGRLALSYRAQDDLGLAAVSATIRRAGSDEVISFALPLSREKPDMRAQRDLTKHLWSGTPVTITLEAKDTKGQVAETPATAFVLPERPFRHPVAREIVAARRELVDTELQSRARAAAMLEAILMRPQRFGDDIVVVLALRAGISGLMYRMGPERVDGVRTLLWETALRVEEGTRALASSDLDRAEEALERALEEGADPAEIERLTEELREAMQRFMEAMMREMGQQQMAPMPFDPGTMQMSNMQDLQQMLDQLREAATTGARDAAREMLSQLKQMLEALRNARPMTAEQQQQMQQAQQLMKQLGDLIQKQKDLADRTLREREKDRSARNIQPYLDAMRQMMDEQERLRQQLGDAMRQAGEMMGEIPENLGAAERAMKEAGRALGAGEGDRAIEAQAEALRALQQGRDQTQQALGQQMGPGFAMMPYGRGMPNGQGRDPFGREPGRNEDGQGKYGNGPVGIPDRDEMRRAREILEDLRQRANDPSRSEGEREYIRRLLDFF